MDEKEKLSTLAVVPLYKQLKRLLEDALNDGTWKPGESLPSEPELAGNMASAASLFERL